jgi:outer membrane immunogenic protein
MVKNILLAGIAFVALVAPAAAADMPIKAPAPVVVDIWSGGYVGANVGYAWGHDSIDSIATPGNCASAGAGCLAAPLNALSPAMAQALTFSNISLQRKGWIYGGQAGHNFLVHNMFWTNDGVIGVEVDFQGVSDSHSTSVNGGAPLVAPLINTTASTLTVSEKIQSLGTLRGRAGWLWGPNTLIYATAGVAFADARTAVTANSALLGPAVGGSVPFTGAGFLNTELFGPVIGGGIEWKWTANWSVKAEYLYADLGNLVVNTGPAVNVQATTGLIQGQATVQTTSHVHENIARIGVNYKFW